MNGRQDIDERTEELREKFRAQESVRHSESVDELSEKIPPNWRTKSA
jgi:hypothetical protein